VQKKPAGDLRNTIYEQKTRSARRLSPTRLFLYRMLVPVALLLLRTAIAWCRIVQVKGGEHVSTAIREAPSFIPVYWHQQQLLCVQQLLKLRDSGVRLGFLISPSVDGEIGAMLVRRIGAAVIRGSASHTGARTLRDYYEALVRQGISPAITPDGPRGPVLKFKPGAILLSQLSQRPIVPLAFAASRAWRVGWDSFVIPKPFARIAIVIGEPVRVPKGLDAATLERLQNDMEARLTALSGEATALLQTGNRASLKNTNA
jgi:lysophospholipid acyltransferase (LPLAT)-like uncharacterized protein